MDLEIKGAAGWVRVATTREFGDGTLVASIPYDELRSIAGLPADPTKANFRGVEARVGSRSCVMVLANDIWSAGLHTVDVRILRQPPPAPRITSLR